jgi:hypothetical protein
MPAIEYESRTYVLKTLKFMCLKCRNMCVTSNPYPDTVMCKCGAVRIDGGISMGATINGNPWAYEDYSIYRAENRPKTELSHEIITHKHQQLRENMIVQYRRQGLTEKDLDEIKSRR